MEILPVLIALAVMVKMLMPIILKQIKKRFYVLLREKI
jgi:hypothetical protein